MLHPSPGHQAVYPPSPTQPASALGSSNTNAPFMAPLLGTEPSHPSSVATPPSSLATNLVSMANGASQLRVAMAAANQEGVSIATAKPAVSMATPASMATLVEGVGLGFAPSRGLQPRKATSSRTHHHREHKDRRRSRRSNNSRRGSWYENPQYGDSDTESSRRKHSSVKDTGISKKSASTDDLFIREDHGMPQPTPPPRRRHTDLNKVAYLTSHLLERREESNLCNNIHSGDNNTPSRHHKNVAAAADGGLNIDELGRSIDPPSVPDPPLNNGSSGSFDQGVYGSLSGRNGHGLHQHNTQVSLNGGTEIHHNSHHNSYNGGGGSVGYISDTPGSANSYIAAAAGSAADQVLTGKPPLDRGKAPRCIKSSATAAGKSEQVRISTGEVASCDSEKCKDFEGVGGLNRDESQLERKGSERIFGGKVVRKSHKSEDKDRIISSPVRNKSFGDSEDFKSEKYDKKGNNAQERNTDRENERMTKNERLKEKNDEARRKKETVREFRRKMKERMARERKSSTESEEEMRAKLSSGDGEKRREKPGGHYWQEYNDKYWKLGIKMSPVKKRGDVRHTFGIVEKTKSDRKDSFEDKIQLTRLDAYTSLSKSCDNLTVTVETANQTSAVSDTNNNGSLAPPSVKPSAVSPKSSSSTKLLLKNSKSVADLQTGSSFGGSLRVRNPDALSQHATVRSRRSGVTALSARSVGSDPIQGMTRLLEPEQTRSTDGRKRSVSDLGFTASQHSLSTPRTLALLRNPAFRKVIAKTLDLDPDSSEAEVKDTIEQRWSTQMKAGTGLDASLGSLGKVKVEKVGLKACNSEANIQQRSCDLERSRLEEEEVFVSQDSSSSRLMNMKRSTSDSGLSRLHIPSYEDFKMQRKGHRSRPGSTEVTVPEVIEEEVEGHAMSNSRSQDQCSSPPTPSKSGHSPNFARKYNSANSSHSAIDTTSPKRKLHSVKSSPVVSSLADPASQSEVKERAWSSRSRSRLSKSVSRSTEELDVVENKQSMSKSVSCDHELGNNSFSTQLHNATKSADHGIVAPKRPRRKKKLELMRSQSHSTELHESQSQSSELNATQSLDSEELNDTMVKSSSDSALKSSLDQPTKSDRSRVLQTLGSVAREIKDSIVSKVTRQPIASHVTSSHSNLPEPPTIVVTSPQPSPNENASTTSNASILTLSPRLDECLVVSRNVDSAEGSNAEIGNTMKRVHSREGNTSAYHSETNMTLSNPTLKLSTNTDSEKGSLSRSTDISANREHHISMDTVTMDTVAVDTPSVKPRRSRRKLERDWEQEEEVVIDWTSTPQVRVKGQLTADETEVSRIGRSVSDVHQQVSSRSRVAVAGSRRAYHSDPFTSRGRRGNQRAARVANTGCPDIKEESKQDIVDFLAGKTISYNTDLPSNQSLSPSNHSLVDSGLNDSHGNTVQGVTSPLSSKRPVKPGVEVERVDSGVGRETSAYVHLNQGPCCEDCDQPLSRDADSFLCLRCEKQRAERKDTIAEIVATETSYGADLKVIRSEIYEPLAASGLLTSDQLSTIFINLDELISINQRFNDQLQDALDIANDQGDEDFQTVHIGRLFIEASDMLLAYETYCVNQSAAPALIDQLEREKDLLRVFLHEAQNEVSALRRMDLKSFLMIPVQRITRYPLLLERLYKVTSASHEDRNRLVTARHRIEDILQHINYKTKGSFSLRLKKSSSTSAALLSRAASTESLELSRVAVETVGWPRNDAHVPLTGRVIYSSGSSGGGGTIRGNKQQQLYAAIVTLGKGPMYGDVTSDPVTSNMTSADPLTQLDLKQSALVLVKEKQGKYSAFKDPVYLDSAVVSCDDCVAEIFEVSDMSRHDAFWLRCPQHDDTTVWFNTLRMYTRLLGQKWRGRRNALPNVMIPNLGASE